MSDLKIFVSSTCYDLAPVREQLRSFIRGLGHIAIMSEYSDVLFDPRAHTHTSCIQEIPNCDIVVVIIGSRFGGTAVPEALGSLDISSLETSGMDKWLSSIKEKVSVSQLETAGAIIHNIPLYIFIDTAVWHDHRVYEKNKSNPDVISKIHFPSIEKSDTAKYIFEFINFLRKRDHGNAIQTFSRIEDIQEHLRRQWSAYFQRLLGEQRRGVLRANETHNINEQLEAIKAALLASISSDGLRATAKGSIRFRSLVDLATSLGGAGVLKQDTALPWEDFFDHIKIDGIFEEADKKRASLIFVFKDKSYVVGRFLHRRLLSSLRQDWTDFFHLTAASRSAIVDAVLDAAEARGIYLKRDNSDALPLYELQQLDIYGNRIENEYAVRIPEPSDDDIPF
ncbi:DUF4062 domain-containing protein [Paraliomyxa miuraensis]|uniref:DUF4062 domain-containing protein n=1 Tax=Paraliomyxa miuraensis TaxID=376150 RepID=UPI002256B1FC|nr:DUF4062 domain-containing protein [Paraliomyxa miuraensis]MCX4244209.1 DUF4062 domain-containing protein [Paraliomyxa miuraensis]